MSGCAKAAIIGVVVIVVLGIAFVALLAIGVMRFANEVGDSIEDSPCEFISDEEVSDLVGSDVTAVSGDSVLGQILGVVQDTRLLSDSPSCFISGEDSSAQMWISVYDGGDAEDVFAAWAAVADGEVVSQDSDESGTLTVETDAFRGEDVPGLGEEAFCVDVGFTASGGVFARSDDRIVYVTSLPMEDEDLFSDELCQRLVPVAAALLG